MPVSNFQDAIYFFTRFLNEHNTINTIMHKKALLIYSTDSDLIVSTL
jgi:hypothetical protein